MTAESRNTKSKKDFFSFQALTKVRDVTRFQLSQKHALQDYAQALGQKQFCRNPLSASPLAFSLATPRKIFLPFHLFSAKTSAAIA
ncbi:hypothetical protein V6N12_053989 [Hibiscus sabdariffa]|uniref:Uncharacterized protein n=1 Tax=Hibiscus sabdariffa TaxID=183260 RepID=A0ABR2D978_9ROSI